MAACSPIQRAAGHHLTHRIKFALALNTLPAVSDSKFSEPSKIPAQ
jgi:hypothetical protein